MKIFVRILLVLLLTNTVAFAQHKANNKPIKSVEKSSVKTEKEKPSSVIFNDETYYLEYSVGNNVQWLNEYLQKGENFNSFTKMFTVRSYDTSTATPEQLVANIAALYQQQNPLNKYQVFKGKGDDYCISFIMTQGNIVEFNLFRYTSVKGHPLALQFVYREYIQNNEHKPAMQKMAQAAKTNLNTWKKEIINMSVPEIVRTIKN